MSPSNPPQLGHGQAFTAVYAEGGICGISPTTQSDAFDRQLRFRMRGAGCHCEEHCLYGAPRHIRM
eukprot:6116474-Pleurochrysis_carterae.AAC.1